MAICMDCVFEGALYVKGLMTFDENSEEPEEDKEDELVKELK